MEPSQIDEGAHQIHITGSDVKHIVNVLRMKTGEELWISDGDKKEYHCTIEAIDAEEVCLHILYSQEPDYELPNKIYLFQGLPKADKMELIIQKAVELGAAGIVPVSTKNAVVKLDAKKEEAKRKRWQAIAESAAKQSGRSLMPQVMGLMTLGQAFDYIEKEQFALRLIPYEHEDGMEGSRQELSRVAPGQDIAVFIGPEGGFDEAEISLALKKGVRPVSLGKRILRTETAGLAMLSVLMMRLEGGL